MFSSLSVLNNIRSAGPCKIRRKKDLNCLIFYKIQTRNMLSLFLTNLNVSKAGPLADPNHHKEVICLNFTENEKINGI
jgi:hypothetical protein